MDAAIRKDSRFSHMLKDAKFRKLPKKKVKVKIDKRFESMFKEKKFQMKYNVDKRGRHVKAGESEDLKKYYEISSESNDSDSDSDEEEEKKKEQDVDGNREIGNKTSEKRKDVIQVSEKEKETLTPDIKKKLKDLTIDYARGEGAIFSDSSSDEESSDEEEQFEFDHDWGELDKDAEHTDKATNRIAVCNLDWDRIEATDLMVLFNSFLPPGGLISSVTIYPSEFGIQRMKDEEEKGPAELVEGSTNGKEEDASQLQMEKLRKYQLNRLRYYYAVVVFDSPQTADVVYTECDGIDYECSSSKLDLRFIPDDTTFDQEPRETCTHLPDLPSYKPKYFVTSALTKAKVDLTWDETDVNRQEMVKSIHKGNVDESYVKKFLACSSSSEDEDDDDDGNGDNKEDDDDDDDNNCNGEKENDKPKGESNEKTGYIEKYKALLAEVDAKESKSKRNKVNMEVTWNLDLENKASKNVKEIVKGKESKTPFQQYLEKRKEKKKMKQMEKQSQVVQEKNSEIDNGTFSDDDIPSDIDLNDPYFKEEMDEFKVKKPSKKTRKTGLDEEEEEDEETKQKKAELELLLLDNKEGAKHFSLKKIEESEKEKKGKKGKKRKLETGFDDAFKIDVNDERFSALYTSHHFNIDPADPQYKATKGTKELIMEKLKRREREQSGGVQTAKVRAVDRRSKEPKKVDETGDLHRLVKAIKKNTAEGKRKT